MFDDITCRYPLPVEGANALSYQTKDTPAQMLDLYEIREDGTLWHEAYDIEDRSERGAWLKAHPGEPEPEWSLLQLGGCCAKVNRRWEFEPMTGEVRFYDMLEKPHSKSGWIEFSAYFVNGALKHLELLDHRPPGTGMAERENLA